MRINRRKEGNGEGYTKVTNARKARLSQREGQEIRVL